MTIDYTTVYSSAIEHRSRYYQTVLVLYLLVIDVLGTVLGPLRVFEVWNTASIVYANVGFIVLFVFATRGPSSLIPKDFFAVLLIVMFTMGALVGITNIDTDEAQRNYLSHGFQLISAYVMYALGQDRWRFLWNEASMRPVMLALVAADMAGTALTYVYGFQFDLGGYLVGLGSSLLALCYFLPRHRLFALIAFAAVVLSGKRGVSVAALVVVAIHFLLPALRQRRQQTSVTTIAAVAGSILAVAFTTALLRSDVVSEITELLEYRVESIPTAVFGSESDDATRVAAGGRYEEVDALLGDLTPTEWLVGLGFGRTFTYFQDDAFVEIHQAHFTPATLVARFGVPLAFVFMGFIVLVVARSLRMRIRNRQAVFAPTCETLLLYVIGQGINSLTAFTLFIDLPFFLFVGALTQMPSSKTDGGS